MVRLLLHSLVRHCIASGVVADTFASELFDKLRTIIVYFVLSARRTHNINILQAVRVPTYGRTVSTPASACESVSEASVSPTFSDEGVDATPAPRGTARHCAAQLTESIYDMLQRTTLKNKSVYAALLRWARHATHETKGALLMGDGIPADTLDYSAGYLLSFIVWRNAIVRQLTEASLSVRVCVTRKCSCMLGVHHVMFRVTSVPGDDCMIVGPLAPSADADWLGGRSNLQLQAREVDGRAVPVKDAPGGSTAECVLPTMYVFCVSEGLPDIPQEPLAPATHACETLCPDLALWMNIVSCCSLDHLCLAFAALHRKDSGFGTNTHIPRLQGCSRDDSSLALILHVCCGVRCAEDAWPLWQREDKPGTV